MNINEIEMEIKRLENGEADYNTCQRLSSLYIVRDHLTGEKPSEGKSRAYIGGSHFLSIAGSKDPDAVLTILDEHIECIKTLYPSEYNVLMKRISEL